MYIYYIYKKSNINVLREIKVFNDLPGIPSGNTRFITFSVSRSILYFMTALFIHSIINIIFSGICTRFIQPTVIS